MIQESEGVILTSPTLAKPCCQYLTANGCAQTATEPQLGAENFVHRRMLTCPSSNCVVCRNLVSGRCDRNQQEAYSENSQQRMAFHISTPLGTTVRVQSQFDPS